MSKNNSLLLAVAIAFYAMITLFHLASADAGYSHYRDIHLGTAIEYAKHGTDILRPVIVGFNATGTPTPQEFPLWQAMAGGLFKVLGPWFGWANLLSLILFASALWPLYALAKESLGQRGAWWTVVFFLSQPILILLSGQASADGLSFAFALWFLFFANQLICRPGTMFLTLSVLFGSLSAVTKLPLFMSVGLTSFLLLLVRAPRSVKAWSYLAVTGVVIAAAFAVWTRYSESCLAVAELPYVDLRLSHNPGMWRWYFGDWHYRLNPFNWAKGAWAALNSLFGSFALVALALIGFFISPPLAKRWLLAAFVVVLIFSHLVLVHRHYFILFSPAVALLCAAAIRRLEDLARVREGRKAAGAASVIVVMLLLSATQGLMGMKVVLDYDSYPHAMAQIIATNTTPDDKLLIEGGGWGGEVLFLADRRGLTIDDTKLLEDPRIFDRLQSLGYTRLVMISESPLLHALQAIDPGNLKRERIGYRIALTHMADSWKTVYQSEDILIKDLPARQSTD